MPHHSHLFRGKISATRERKIDKVLKPFDAHVVTYSDPGSGPRGWVDSPNRGFPFDRDREVAMTDALKAAGLYPIVPERGTR